MIIHFLLLQKQMPFSNGESYLRGIPTIHYKENLFESEADWLEQKGQGILRAGGPAVDVI